jgi:signal transduction histidine kinase
MRARVELLQRVAVAANSTSDAGAVMRTALREVCGLTGWPLGHVYLRDPDEPIRLVPSNWWHVAEGEFETFRAVTARTPVARGVGLPGRVFATRRPHEVLDVADDPNLPRFAMAADRGVRSGFAFPVLVGEDVAAVLEFFTPEVDELGGELLAVMANVGTQLGRVVERERAAREREEANRELREANELKSRFVSTAAHELRSPLAAMTGFVALMDDAWEDLDEASKRDYVRSIGRQATRLQRLVGDLLTVSRLEAGATDPQQQPVRLRAAVDEVITDLRLDAVEIDCPPDQFVLVDPDHLTQILVNELSNARKHGRPPFRVVARPVRDVVEAVDIRVCDAGPGVPDTFVPRLFARFSRGAAGGSGGSGLGLSIVSGLAAANGGTAWYEPAEPSGACFAVRLPAA